MECNYRCEKLIRALISIVAARISMVTDWPHYGFLKIGNLLKIMGHDLGHYRINVFV